MARGVYERTPLAERYFGYGDKVPSQPKGGAAALKADKVWGEATINCCAMTAATNHPKIGDKYKLRLEKEVVAELVGVDAQYSCMLSAVQNGVVPGIWQAGTKDKIEKDGTAHLITAASLIVLGKRDQKAKTYNIVSEVTDRRARQIPALFDAMKVEFALKNGRAPTKEEIADLVREDKLGIFNSRGIADVTYTVRSVQRTPNRSNSQMGIPKKRENRSAASLKSGKGTSRAEMNRRTKAWKEADQCRRRIQGIKVRLAEFEQRMEIIKNLEEA